MDTEYYYCGTCKHGNLYAKGCPKCKQEYEKKKNRNTRKKEQARQTQSIENR